MTSYRILKTQHIQKEIHSLSSTIYGSCYQHLPCHASQEPLSAVFSATPAHICQTRSHFSIPMATAWAQGTRSLSGLAQYAPESSTWLLFFFAIPSHSTPVTRVIFLKYHFHSFPFGNSLKYKMESKTNQNNRWDTPWSAIVCFTFIHHHFLRQLPSSSLMEEVLEVLETCIHICVPVHLLVFSLPGEFLLSL